jgi:hypothetical protein
MFCPVSQGAAVEREVERAVAMVVAATVAAERGQGRSSTTAKAPSH